jgi:alpha-beta hydrolase superfamily lysophospholipase
MVCEETKMISKLDVWVPAEGGIGLGAWHPAITMAHGFAGTREHGLERFTRAFATAGFVVLVHDHRNFGTSGGDLRGDVDPWVQIRDWRRAICYLEARPEVDPARIGL